MSKCIIHFAVVALAFAVSVRQTRAADLQVRPVAISGEPAYGLPPDVTFSGGGTPTISRTGLAGFIGVVQGPGITTQNRIGIWVERVDGTTALIARTGEQAPGAAAGMVFLNGGLGAPKISESGSASFDALLTGPGVTSSNNSGTWAENNGTLMVAVIEGEQAPGFPTGETLDIVGPPAFADTDIFAYRSSTSNGNDGLWVGPVGSPSLVLQTGDVLPGTGGATVFKFSLFDVQISPHNTVPFVVTYLGTPLLSSGVFLSTDTGLQLVAKSLDPAPGTSATFSDFFPNARVTINAADNIAFQASLSGPDVTEANDIGIWSTNADGTINLIVREGIPAPGFSDGVVFSELLHRPLIIGNDGTVYFFAKLSGPGIDLTNEFGLWSGNGTVLTSIAQDGMQAPGLAADIKFLEVGGNLVFPPSRSPSEPAVNSDGTIAFFATLTGPGVGIDNDDGFWFHDGTELRQAARSGQTFDTDEAGLLTLTSIAIPSISPFDGSNNNNGRPSFLSDNGELIFAATTEDANGLPRNGIFVAQIDNATAGCVGDIDGDQDIDQTDAELFVSVLLDIDTGNADHLTRADLNSDGAVNGIDVGSFVMRQLLGCN